VRLLSAQGRLLAVDANLRAAGRLLGSLWASEPLRVPEPSCPIQAGDNSEAPKSGAWTALQTPCSYRGQPDAFAAA
jgi:hypothetical protein